VRGPLKSCNSVRRKKSSADIARFQEEESST
jgi:hypothetical protein